MIDIEKGATRGDSRLATQFANLCTYEDMNSRHELATGEAIRGLKNLIFLF